jgi:hypothetical protein
MSSFWRHVFLLAAMASTLALVWPSTSLAQVRVSNPYEHSWVFSPGLTLGGSNTGNSKSSLLLGGELSTLYFWEKYYAGGVVDAVRDWHRGGYRMMAGPMIGYLFWGIDGGYLLDNSLGGLHHGVAVRTFMSIGFLSIFARYGAVIHAPAFVDFGLLIKLPMPSGLFFP